MTRLLRLLGALGVMLVGAGTLSLSLTASPSKASAQGCVLIFCPPPTTTTVPTPTTTSTPTTTTVASTVPPGPAGSPEFAASFPPCSGSLCSSTPAVVEATSSSSAGLQAVSVTWLPQTGRPSGAPEPPNRTAVLSLAEATGCPGRPIPPAGEDVTCWAFPSSLDDQSFVLNGTYQVRGCPSASNCPTASFGDPSDIGVAVPPASPRNLSATSTKGEVTLTWSPSADPEPDLVGYAVDRDGQQIYSCSTDGAGAACKQPLGAGDIPGKGSWTYSVVALRLGVNASASSIVASPAAGAPERTVTAAAPPVGSVDTSQGASQGATAYLPPVVSPQSAVSPATPVPDSPVPDYGAATSAGAGDSPAVAGVPAAPSSPTLPYSPTGMAAAGGTALASGSHAGSPSGSSGRRDVVPAGLVAVALLTLALAAHVYYLRSELMVRDARAQAGLEPGSV